MKIKTFCKNWHLLSLMFTTLLVVLFYAFLNSKITVDNNSNGISPSNNIPQIEDQGLNNLLELSNTAHIQTSGLIEVCNYDQFSQDCSGINVKYSWCEQSDIPDTCTPQAIQNAVDDVGDNGEVYIKRGEYSFDSDNEYRVEVGDPQGNWQRYRGFVVIDNKSLKISGEGEETKLIGAGVIPTHKVFYGATVLCLNSNSFEITNVSVRDSNDLVDGIVLANGTKAQIKNNIIDNNGFAGVVTYGNVEVSIENNIIMNNVAEGIEIENGVKVDIINNTIVQNSGKVGRPGGVSLYRSPDVILVNNIIVNNYDKGVFRDNAGAEHVGQLAGNYNNVWRNLVQGVDEQNWIGTPKGSESISKDPLFVDEQNGDFHLNNDSPSRNTGDPRRCNKDGTRSDMGAFGGGGLCEGASGSLKIKIKLERKNINGNTYYANDHVRVKLESEDGSHMKNFYIPVDNSGFGLVESLNDLPTAKYVFYIKPEQYISKKLGSLLIRSNTLTEIHIEPEFRVGDVNVSSYDFINALDFSLFIKYLREQDFERGDFNVDRAVNAVDYSIMLKTYREERIGDLVADPE